MPKVTVIVPTLNRGNLVIATLDSIIANHYPHFEMILVDQSTTDETEIAISTYKNNASFQYYRSASRGAGLARNIGLRKASSEYLLFTDDDCTVPPDWIEKMVLKLEQNPRAALAFCSVLPGEHDSGKGVIPHYIYKKFRVVDSIKAYHQSIGMSAGLGARRLALLELGGFDENLGPGSLFRSAEDHDLALRALFAEWQVVETPETAVVHHGFRTYSEFRELTKRDWYGMGAAEGKHLKCGHLQVLYLIVYNLIVRSFLEPISDVFRLKKPTGFKRFFYFLMGFIEAYKTPIDRHKIHFLINRAS
jgi:glycosyltransferase involved in cell wall biosynthesis